MIILNSFVVISSCILIVVSYTMHLLNKYKYLRVKHEELSRYDNVFAFIFFSKTSIAIKYTDQLLIPFPIREGITGRSINVWVITFYSAIIFVVVYIVINPYIRKLFE